MSPTRSIATFARTRKPRGSNRVDTLIEAIYYRHAVGKQINILDISKIYAAGRGALETGADPEPAIIAAIAQYCTPSGS